MASQQAPRLTPTKLIAKKGTLHEEGLKLAVRNALLTIEAVTPIMHDALRPLTLHSSPISFGFPAKYFVIWEKRWFIPLKKFPAQHGNEKIIQYIQDIPNILC